MIGNDDFRILGELTQAAATIDKLKADYQIYLRNSDLGRMSQTRQAIVKQVQIVRNKVKILSERGFG